MSGYQATAIPPAAQQQMLSVGQSFPGTTQRGSAFEVPLPLPAGTITLGITFPGNFPQQPPVMFVLNDIAHQMIGPDLRVLYPQPRDWQPGYSMLTILRTIHNAFKQNPPTVRQRSSAQPVQPSPPSNPMQPPSSLPQQTPLQPPANPQPAAIPARAVPQLDVNRALSQCPYLSHRSEKLTRLSNPAELEDFVSTLPEIRQLTDERDNLLRTNLRLAEDNLALKPEIDALTMSHQKTISQMQAERSELDSVMRQAHECESVNATLARFKISSAVRAASPVQEARRAVLRYLH